MTRSEPAYDHGDKVQRFLLGEHDLGLQSARVRLRELVSARMRPRAREHDQAPGFTEKGLQRRKGIVPLVGSQEQRALVAPLINR